MLIKCLERTVLTIIFSPIEMFGGPRIDAIKLGLVSVIRPQNMTDRPVFERRMDPLSEVFGSMRIQDAIYTRLEATAPWGFRYSGDTVPRIRFGLMVAIGSSEIQEPAASHPALRRRCFHFILSDEPFTMLDHPRSAVVDYRE